MILAGRRINDNMGSFIVDQVSKLMQKKDIKIKGAHILIMGLAFKENCPDIRNTKVIDLIKKFNSLDCNVDVYDPWVNEDEAFDEYNINLIAQPSNRKYDAIVLAVAHNEFLNLDIRKLTHSESVIFDVKSFLPSINRRTILRL